MADGDGEMQNIYVIRVDVGLPEERIVYAHDVGIAPQPAEPHRLGAYVVGTYTEVKVLSYGTYGHVGVVDRDFERRVHVSHSVIVLAKTTARINHPAVGPQQSLGIVLVRSRVTVKRHALPDTHPVVIQTVHQLKTKRRSYTDYCHVSKHHVNVVNEASRVPGAHELNAFDKKHHYKHRKRHGAHYNEHLRQREQEHAVNGGCKHRHPREYIPAVKLGSLSPYEYLRKHIRHRNKHDKKHKKYSASDCTPDAVLHFTLLGNELHQILPRSLKIM